MEKKIFIGFIVNIGLYLFCRAKIFFNFLLQNLQIIPNVRECVQKCAKLCDYVQKKIFLQFIWYCYILYFHLYSSFLQDSLVIVKQFCIFLRSQIYFLKGIVELERYEAWNLALRIKDVALSNVATRRFAESKIQWSHLFLGFS